MPIRQPSVFKRVDSVRILHITPYFPPTWSYGGIPRIVDGLSAAQSKLGSEVSVLTTDAFNAEKRAGIPRLRQHGSVTVLTLNNLSNRLAYHQQLFLPRGMAKGLKELPQPDIIHLHGHRHLLNNYALEYAQKRRIPLILTANGTLRRHEQKQRLKRIWDWAISGKIPTAVNHCIAVSRADVAFHREAGVSPEKITLIENGLDLGEFSPLPKPGSFRKEHDLKDGKIIAYLGRISPRKGVDHLVSAFIKANLNATLVIAGNDMGGLKTAQAISGKRNDIRFVGLLEGRDRLKLLRDSAVLVYPSKDEIFGLAPFEGLLCGSPAVVSDDCGCGELIATSQAGLLAPYGDHDALGRALRILINDTVAAEAMVRRGRAFINKHLRFDKVAERHLELYKKCLV